MTWQTDVMEALDGSDAPVPLMKHATGWAVRGESVPYHIVLVTGEGSQSLKVCLVPMIRDLWIIEDLDELAQRPTWPQYLYLGDFDAWAAADPVDPNSFLYEVQANGPSTYHFVGTPCPGYRFRDHCRHIDVVPGESIQQRFDDISDQV